MSLSVYNAERLAQRIGKGRPFDVVIAHELLTSGYAGLQAGRILPGCLLILDNVEYPFLSGRSGQAVAAEARRDPLGDQVLSEFLAAVANRYDAVFATSRGR